MAYFKQNAGNVNIPSNRGNTQFRHGEGVDLIKASEEEARIGNATIQDKLDVKDTPLSRMTSYKTTVTYYQQKVTGRNDYITNTANLGNTDVNKVPFNKIKEFVIVCSDALNVNIEKNENNTSLMGDGTATVLPKTIKPLVNDHFVMRTLNKNNLYRVTEVTKSSIEQDSAYSITYQLVEEDSEEHLAKVEQNVVETYYFVYSHVGTSFRTVFKEDEYKALESLERMYQTMGELYNEFFYDNDKNTYILNYNGADIKDEEGIPIEESRLEDQPWCRVNVLDGRQEEILPPKLNNSDIWYGSKMYDRFLVDFITRTGLFSNINRKVFRITQLQTDNERWYSRTVFYALENRNVNRLQFRYIVPSPVTRVTIASTLNLYGVVSLEPSMVNASNCLQVYPELLIPDMMRKDLADRSLNDLSVNTYNDMVDLMCETIGLYVNKRETAILNRLLLLEEHLDEFSQLSIRDQNTFYLFPMLAFVVRKEMDRLSDINFGLAMFA